MKDEAYVLSSPMTSCRTELLSHRSIGGYTTRRSLTKPPPPPQTTFNGVYEGDFTMMTDSMKSPKYKQQQQNLHHQHPRQEPLHLSWSDQNEDHLEDEVDEEIRGKPFERVYAEKAATVKKQQQQRRQHSLWDDYKSYLFTREQCKRIEAKFENIKKNLIYRRVVFSFRFITAIMIWLLNGLLQNILLPSFDFACATLRGRNILRGCTRRLLWYMILAKCDNLQLFGLIVVLSPLLFLAALMGLLVTLYCDMKNLVFGFISYVRFRCDLEPLNF